jgi:methyl-accepting chemotaxis protein
MREMAQVAQESAQVSKQVQAAIAQLNDLADSLSER